METAKLPKQRAAVSAFISWLEGSYAELSLGRDDLNRNPVGSLSRNSGSGDHRGFKRSGRGGFFGNHHAGDHDLLEWILQIGQTSGLVDWLAGKMEPVLDFLFPHLEKGHPARKHMAVNMIANMLGLGSAATPAGLRAMKALKKPGEDTASREMCTFLIINISSLQLIPVTIVAYRSQFGSSDPAAVTGPALAATIISTAAGVIFCKLMDRK